MIEFNTKNKTYICPFCDCRQSFNDSSSDVCNTGYKDNYSTRNQEWLVADIAIHFLKCTNTKCSKISVIIIHGMEQIDLIPKFTCKHYPNYIPEQIRNDYVEGVAVLERSPRAAATMFRRCLQGMIRDFWKVKAKNLYEEISLLQDKISTSQWKAIDSVRTIGNIGAHMEKDVNLIIDVDIKDAEQLQKLIELLMDKWYVARHDEEELYQKISNIADEKENKKQA